MYAGELKGLSPQKIKLLIKEMEKGRDASQASLDLILTSTKKVNGTTKKELKKAIRFFENSINRALEVKEELIYKERVEKAKAASAKSLARLRAKMKK